MTKSTPTLTQSGLLAVLLQRQRYKVIQLAWRGAHRKHVRAAVWSTLTWPFRARTARGLVDDSAKPLVRIVPRMLESFTKPSAMSHQIHTYTELRQQIHDDLRIQHPEWVNSDGSSPTCDSYESRLIELLDALTRRGSNEPIAAPHRALEQGLNRIDTVAV